VQLQNTATAQQISLQPGQSLAITVNGEDYNVVLKELGSDYAVLRIPGTTQDVRIRLSQDNTYDMNGDGQSDLQIKLQSISSGFAQMLATPLIAAESKAVLVQASMSWAMPIWFAVTVLSLIALWWIVSSRQHAGQKRSH
jgi:bifunctional DNA-binding transcriptional regulator/antitoxin component of YhaV-PrlF toxin-antitoxin module